MKYEIILFLLFGGIGIFHIVNAEVYVPKDEMLGYFDSNGIYTVAGAVKNTENYTVSSTLRLVVDSGSNKIQLEQRLPSVFPGKDMPFKIKIPQITDTDTSIEKTTVTFVQDNIARQSNVEVVYDRDLTQHADGHLSGKIINTGTQTEHNLRVYATVHGQNNSFIDAAQSLEQIDQMAPGQTIQFTLYPDPSVAKNVHYYSCFALGDPTVVPLSVTRNGKNFDFKYDSPAASFTVKGFDKTGTKLALVGINSFKFPTYVVFDFPPLSENEKFDVQINDKSVKFIQSKNEDGNWHVAFNIEGSTQNQVVISGFEKPDSILPSNDQQDTSMPREVDYSTLYYAVAALSVAAVAAYVISRKKLTRRA